MTPKNNVRIVHLTKNRVRFVSERIGEDCDESRLEAQISEFRYAKSVRVNKKAKSIIVGFDSNLNEIKEFIENLPIANFNKLFQKLHMAGAYSPTRLQRLGCRRKVCAP